MSYQKLDSFELPKGFRGRNFVIVQVWWFVQCTLFALSPQVCYGWRRMLLRLFGANIGEKVIIRPTVRITYPWKLSIGENSWIGDHVDLYSLGEIDIGSNCVVSQKSYLCTGSHDYTKESFDIFQKKIVIENEAWLATDVFVAPGVVIGKGTLIGARSSVFSSVPSGKICVGSPAKVVGERD